ncbi:MAG TPA: sigma-70 family RNA polymerase sigma factor [Hanamia sp.]|nr:sigma-70 family RNA polymerase sigma factor [Hanamia sp.]
MLTNEIYNEEEIIALIIHGDEAAFAIFFEHYRDKIYSVAYKLTHSTTIAEDVVEDVFLKIWLKRDNLGAIQNFDAYLFTIARNDVYKVLKITAKNYKVSELTELNQLIAKNNTEDYLMDKEYSSLLQKAIDRLPQQQKQVYHLIKVQDMKREAVANILQIQPETVKFHLSQAMKNIRSFCMIHLKTFVGIIILLYCHS